MKILIQGLFVVLFSLTASAQFERFAPIVSVEHPAAFPVRQLPVPDLSTASHGTLAFDESLPGRLQAAMDALYAKTSPHGKHGVAAAIIVPGQPMWVGSVGESHPGVPLRADHLFEIASNSKTFTAAFIMQLVEEGKVSLSDSLWKWIPTYENIDSTITIRQLLDHSSGIYDYLNDDPLAEILSRSYFYEPEKVWTPEEILTYYIGKPNFKAGTSYKYSNTNFLLLGVIAEKAAGAEYASEIRRRFLSPLNLSSTFVGWKDSIIGEFTHNWLDTATFEPMVDLGEIEKTSQLSMAGAAGGYVSTPADLAVWVKALYESDQLLADSSRTQMMKVKNWSNGMRYGLGTVRVPFGTKYFYGHTGGLPGFLSNMFNNPKDSVTFVIYMNSGYFDGDVTLNDYAVALLSEIYKPAAGVDDKAGGSVALSISSNPIKDHATIRMILPETNTINLALFNTLGQEVAVLAKGNFQAGEHSIPLSSASLPVGSYTVQLTVQGSTVHHKILLVR